MPGTAVAPGTSTSTPSALASAEYGVDAQEHEPLRRNGNPSALSHRHNSLAAESSDSRRRQARFSDQASRIAAILGWLEQRIGRRTDRIAMPAPPWKCHWTWRSGPILRDRHSSGRECRSGRRSQCGLPQGDHVKVVGRGARPLPIGPACRTDGLRPEAGIASPHGCAAHFGALKPRASAQAVAAGHRLPGGKSGPSIGKAQGSIGRLVGRNAIRTQRTSQRTNALRSRDPGTTPRRTRLASEERTADGVNGNQRREGTGCGVPDRKVDSRSANF